MNYTIQSKKVVYNVNNDSILEYYSGNEGEVVFDSIQEFKCYKVLRKLNIPIEIHKKIKCLDWKIDFTLHYLSKALWEKSIFCNLGYKLHTKKYLYVEFKGVVDDGTVNRYKALPPILRSSLVIVTKDSSQIVYFDTYNGTIVKDATLSIGDLKHGCKARSI